MSRSRRKSRCIGHTCARSDQPWKAKAARTFRHAAELAARADPNEQTLPVRRWALVNPWDAPKDRKQRVPNADWKMLRK